MGTQTLTLNLVTHRTPRHSPYILTVSTQTLTLHLVTHRTPWYSPYNLTVGTQTLTLNLVTHRTPRHSLYILTVSTQTLTLCSARDWDGEDYLRIIPRVVLVEDPRLLKGPL